MPRKHARFDAVRTLGLTFPDVEEGTTYGSPALKVRGRIFACMAVHRSAEPDTLVVRVGFDRRDELVTHQPRIYYLTPHYEPYPCVLARLGQITDDALRDLLLMGWRFMSRTTHVSVRTRKRKTTM
jgi:hypothetical protein